MFYHSINPNTNFVVSTGASGGSCTPPYGGTGSGSLGGCAFFIDNIVIESCRACPVNSYSDDGSPSCVCNDGYVI